MISGPARGGGAPHFSLFELTRYLANKQHDELGLHQWRMVPAQPVHPKDPEATHNHNQRQKEDNYVLEQAEVA